MPEVAGSIEVEVRADLDPYTRDLALAQQQAVRANASIAGALKGVSNATDLATESTEKFQKAQEVLSKFLKGSFNEVISQIGKLAGEYKGLLGIGGIGAAFYSFGRAVTFAKNAAEAASEEFEQLDNRLKSTQGALGITTVDLIELTRAIGESTDRSSKDLAKLALELGSTGEIQGENLREALELLPAIAGRVGSLSKAAEILGAALRNPAENFRLLRQAGVEFDKDTQQRIENMRLFEQRAEAARIVLAELRDELDVDQREEGWNKLGESVTRLAANIAGAVAAMFNLEGVTSTISNGVERLNRFFFPKTLQDNINAAQVSLEGAKDTLDAFTNSAAAAVPILGAMTTAALQAGVASRDLALYIAQVAKAETDAAVAMDAMNRRAARQREEVDGVTRGLRNQLQALQGTSAQGQARAQARQLGLDPGSETVKNWERLYEAIRKAQRARSREGQPDMITLENERIGRQIELLRFSNEEQKIQQELLRIELALKRQGRDVDQERLKALGDRMRLLRDTRALVSTIEEGFSSLFSNMTSALSEFAATGKFKFKDFANSVIRDLVRIATQAFVTKPLLQLITGIANPIVAGLGGGSATPQIAGLQHGGSFTVPGAGNSDKPALLVGLTPGEDVRVTPAGQRLAGGGGRVTVVNNVNSSKDFEVESKERSGPNGERIIEQTFNEVMRRISRGDADPTFGSRFGVRPRTVQR